MNALEVHNLSKRIGRTDVLRGLTWSIPRGSICGMDESEARHRI
jgi:ABC-type multidrug transport system ATPase subunit